MYRASLWREVYRVESILRGPEYTREYMTKSKKKTMLAWAPIIFTFFFNPRFLNLFHLALHAKKSRKPLMNISGN